MPSVKIPKGDTAVQVSIVDNGARISGPLSLFMEPPLLEHLTTAEPPLKAPAYVFLIEHEALGRKVVFDLGIRREILSCAPNVLKYHNAFSFFPGKDVSEVLEENHDALDAIEAVIWSHHHTDHIGNPSAFPPTTDLVVGPGFKETELPGYPENAEAKILTTDYRGRTLRQLDFLTESKGLKIGGFKAIDWFGDGSFYLLETPGHSIDHMAAMARTSVEPPTFIMMGGDLGHHPSQFRPTELLPFPTELEPSPFGPESRLNIRRNVCPCELFINHVHPEHSDSQPFLQIRTGHPYNRDMAAEALKKTEAFDADENIMVIMAHDWTLLNVLEYYPKRANHWMEAGWKERGRWEFLKDFTKLVEENFLKC